VACSLLPFTVKLSGLIYLASALALGAGFLVYAVKIYREYSDQLARKTFRYSIIYLTALFAALLVDHYFRITL
jgi:protoheme IX farnesyltransferase